MNFSWAKLALFLGIGTVIAGIIYLFQSDDSPEDGPSSEQSTEHTPRPEPPKKASPAYISKKDFLSLLKAINELALEKHNKLKQWYYKTRRLFNSDEEYRKIVEEFIRKDSETVKDAAEELLERNKISLHTYNEGLRLYAGEKESSELKNDFKNKMYTHCSHPVVLGPEKLIKIFKFQLERLEELDQQYPSIVNVVNMAKIEDDIFYKFGFEPDQIISAAIEYQSEVRGQWEKVVRQQQRLSQ